MITKFHEWQFNISLHVRYNFYIYNHAQKYIYFLFSSDNRPEYSLPDQILDDIPEISELTSHARTAKWLELGIQLKLDDVDLKQCNSCAALYQLWLEENGRHATRRMLLAALRAIRQNADADSYVDHLQTILMVSDVVKNNPYIISWKLH